MANTNDRIRVWDLPVRLFHWTLVILMATSYFSGRAGGDWMKFHFWSGYAILTLLLFRIAWGFVGSTTARFSDFVKGPSAAFRHLAELAGADRPRDAGHNPLGGAMVVVLIFAVLAQVVAGLFSADTDIGMVNGPLTPAWSPTSGSSAATALPHLLGQRAAGPGRPARAGGDRLPGVEAAEPDRRHDPRPQAARRCRASRASRRRRCSFASGRLAISLLIACAADRLFHRALGG